MNFEEIAEIAVKEWKASQNIYELSESLRVVNKFQPKIIVEIGIENCGSLAAWSSVSQPDLVIGIDPFTLQKTGEIKKLIDRQIDTFKIKVIPYHSHAEECFAQLEKLLEERKVDFLFIDRDHWYGTVYKDWILYKKYLNIKSLVMFHDIFYSDELWNSGSQVSHLWKLLKRQYSYDEFYRNSTMGMGVLYL